MSSRAQGFDKVEDFFKFDRSGPRMNRPREASSRGKSDMQYDHSRNDGRRMYQTCSSMPSRQERRGVDWWSDSDATIAVV